MDRGEDESSAWAICRSSLGLNQDGTEDSKKVKMPEDELRIRAESEISKRRYGEGPVLRKNMVVAQAIGEYVNGDQEGDLDEKKLRKIASNYKKYPRQVPIYALGDHVEDLDQRLPDGWVEDAWINSDGDLEIDAKIHGEAVAYVVGDRIRGASIGAQEGKDYDGTSIGPVLHHVLLTNSPFIKGLNIAAAIAKGGSPVVLHFTALPEKKMLDKDKKEDLERKAKGGEGVEFKDQNEALEVLLTESRGEIRELNATVENLKQELSELRKESDNNPSDKENRQLKQQVLAMRVRELVKRGVDAGQFTHEEVTGYDNTSDSVTLAWFKNSIFENDVNILKQNLKTRPKKTMRREFSSGTGFKDTDDEQGYSAEDKENIREQGKDPEKLVHAKKGAMSLTQFKRHRAAMKG
jgi:hypothetical protein